MCRRLQQNSSTAGALGPACTLGPTCLSLDVSCKITPEEAIATAGASLTGLNLLAGGCLLMPEAGTNVSLAQPVTNLGMGGLYQMFVVSEDTLFPSPNRHALLPVFPSV